MHSPSHRSSEQGFTLIELSIVLVIIGLIVGGVLVGQNLIRAAELRSTVTQIEQLNTSVNTFRGKYGGIPGDCNRCFSIFALGAANGDGDGLLESDISTGNVSAWNGEIANFFAMLSSANMIAGNYVASAGVAPVLGSNFPQSKHGRGGLIGVANGGFNYYLIGVQSGTAAFSAPGAGTVLQNTLTPEEAFQLDEKTDDSLPFVGVTRSVVYAASANSTGGTGRFDAPATGAAVCVNATDNYNATLTTPLCQLTFRAN